MNAFSTGPAARLFAAPGMLRLAIPLVILALLAAGCATSEPLPPVVLIDSAKMIAPEATPAPAAEVGGSQAPVCDESTPSALSVWGNDGTDPYFHGIAVYFQDMANLSGIPATLMPADADFAEAMNQHTIGFYTGHGTPASFDVYPVGSTVKITRLLALGQCDESTQDKLRYLVLASCNTFAHGPQKCSDPAAKGYACPGEWQYAGGSAMQNIYTRWGPALGNGLRMACGMSTDAPPGNADGLWAEYGARSVADAIVAKLSLQKDVALCIAKGGPDFADSPLMGDTSFISAANTYDDGYYHLQYAKPFVYPYQPVHGVLIGEDQVEDQLALFESISGSFPECLPVLEIPLAERTLHSGGPAEQDQALTGYASETEALAVHNTETGYVSLAMQAFDELRLSSSSLDRENPYASGIYLMTTTFPADPVQQSQQALRVAVKNVIITFPQLFALNEIAGFRVGRSQDLEALDAFYNEMRSRFDDSRWADPRGKDGQPLVRLLGRDIEVQLNTNGSPISGVSNWQSIEDIEAYWSERVLNPYDAFVRSLEQLPYGIDEESPYRLESWEWGYDVSRLDKSLSRIAYRFRFGPNQGAGYDASTHPPFYSWVEGQEGVNCPPE